MSSGGSRQLLGCRLSLLLFSPTPPFSATPPDFPAWWCFLSRTHCGLLPETVSLLLGAVVEALVEGGALGARLICSTVPWPHPLSKKHLSGPASQVTLRARLWALLKSKRMEEFLKRVLGPGPLPTPPLGGRNCPIRCFSRRESGPLKSKK